MRALGKDAEYFDGGLEARVGFIDDAEWRFAARDEVHGGAHVVRHCKSRCNARPNTQRLERCFGIAPGGYGLRVGQRQSTAVTERRSDRELGLDAQRGGCSARGDQHESRREQFAT